MNFGPFMADGGKSREALNRRILAWWAGNWPLQIFVVALLTLLAIIGHVQPSLVRDLFIAPSAEESAQPFAPGRKSTPADKPDVQPFQVADGECILVVTSEDLFTDANLRAVREVVENLEALPQVSRVLWLDNVPGLNLFGLPEPLLPRDNASPRQMETGRQRTLENPLAVGQLISADGKTLLIHLRMDWFFVTSDAACTSDLRVAAQQAAANVPGNDLQFQVTGRAPLYLMMARQHLRDSWKYQAIGYTIMIVAALVLFRGFSAVVIVAIAPALGVFWTMGMLHFFNLQDNPFNDIIVPVLISLVGVADAVHLMVEIRTQRASGLQVRDAVTRGVARVGLACGLTSLTTAIAFASLAWAHHEIVREFGWCCVLGVVLTFISVLTVVPLGCRSPLGWRLHVGAGKGLIDGQLRRIGPAIAWTLRHHRRFAWLAIGATAVLAAICTQLTPDEKRYSGLSESAESARALRHLDRSLGGLEFGRVDIHWSPESSDGELLEVLLAVDQVLGEEPLLGNPLGLHDLLDALPGEGNSSERMTLLELLPPALKRAFYVPEDRTAWVQFRVQDIGIATYGAVFERVESRLRAIEQDHPDFRLNLEGDTVWRWRNIYRIVMDLATSLGTATLVIWLILTIVYRSIRIGLISIVPNIFPLVATGTILYLTGQYLEIVTVCVFTICIGIAVDDTIHFLTRYQEEVAKAASHSEAIERAFTGVGTALIMTTVVLVTGMLTAIFGDARDARLFGMMGAITLSAALLADLFFLPALLKQFGKRRRGNRGS